MTLDFSNPFSCSVVRPGACLTLWFNIAQKKTTTETQSTQRLHREEAEQRLSCKASSARWSLTGSRLWTFPHGVRNVTQKHSRKCDNLQQIPPTPVACSLRFPRWELLITNRRMTERLTTY